MDLIYWDKETAKQDFLISFPASPTDKKEKRIANQENVKAKNQQKPITSIKIEIFGGSNPQFEYEISVVSFTKHENDKKTDQNFKHTSKKNHDSRSRTNFKVVTTNDCFKTAEKKPRSIQFDEFMRPENEGNTIKFTECLTRKRSSFQKKFIDRKSEWRPNLAESQKADELILRSKRKNIFLFCYL